MHVYRGMNRNHKGGNMREKYRGYTLITMSRPFTPKELFQAVQIKRDGFTVHDCLIGDLETAKRFVDLMALAKEEGAT